MDAVEFWGIAALSAGAAIYLFVQGFRGLHRASLMRDIPTSRIRSAAQGYVELEGTGTTLPGPKIVAPLSGTHCLWWKYSVHQRVKREKSVTWRTVRSGTSDDLFLLDDATGQCIIDPDGAKVIPSRTHNWHGRSATPERGPSAGSIFLGGNYRYYEQLIEAGGPLYAIGAFRTQQAWTHTDQESAARALLAEWKKDQPTLLKRFDVNGDGHIDSREWEAARRVAHMQVRREQAKNVDHDAPALHIMSRSPGHPYLLSGINQHKLIRRHHWQAGTYFLGFLIAGCVLLWLLSTQHVL